MIDGGVDIRVPCLVLRRIALALSLLALAPGCGSKSQLRGVRQSAPSDGGLDAAREGDADVDARLPRDAEPDEADVAPPPFDSGSDGGRDSGRDAARDAGDDAAIDVDAARPANGCSDGLREGYRDIARYPDIAACAGGWERPGVAHASPTFCDRQGGDDGSRPTGAGCGVADLCEVGFHVCLGPSDVESSSPDGCAGSHDAADAFFVTRMSSSGCGVCATGSSTSCTSVDCRSDCAQTSMTTNDVFGCGTLGDTPNAATCGPLDRFSNNLCSALGAPWSCEDDGSGTHEAELLVKTGPAHGGALCCRD